MSTTGEPRVRKRPLLHTNMTGSGTSSARNENLRPLLNTNIPVISRKWPQKTLLTIGKSFSHEEK